MNYMFNNPGIRNIIEHVLVKDAKVHCGPTKNPKDLKVDIHYDDGEVDKMFKKAIFKSRQESAAKKWDYYKIYLRNLYGTSDFSMDRALDNLDRLKERVEARLLYTNTAESIFIRDLLDKNEYSSKSTRRPGVVAKLFHSCYNDKEVMVKVYLYDPMCESLRTSVEANFQNEVLFQIYANRLHGKLDFISPELYSWGQVMRHMLIRDGYKYKCLYLIMEYIPYLTLKEATYSTQHMKNIYERVKRLNEDLSGHLLHHNDLNGGNIAVRNPESPLPDIILMDYGEASIGPRSPFFMF